MSVPRIGRVATTIRLPALVGRDDELRRGRELAEHAAAGRGRLLLIEGEPGIGKTVLLRAILDGAADIIPQVLTGTADELDQGLPFATLDSCLRPWEDYDSQAARVVELIRDGAAENAVIDAAVMLVEQWCAASPVAVAVEDLQWADPASILLLHRLGKVAARLPLLVVATSRGGDSRGDLQALADSWHRRGADYTWLGPLPEPAVDQLVRQLAGADPGPALRAMVAGAAGNPLYIRELVSGLASDDRLRADGDLIDVEPAARPVLPAGLREAITRRLSSLSPGTRQMLQVAALSGATFSLVDMEPVLGTPATQLFGQVREATEAGVLVSLPDSLAFRHPLVRAIAEDDVLPSAPQELDLQIAQALTSRGRLGAGHLLAAGPPAMPVLPSLATLAS